MSENRSPSHLPVAEVQLDERAMKADLVIRGPFSPLINFDALIDVMNEARIVYGSDLSQVHGLLEDFKENRTEHSLCKRTVSKGRPPVKGVDGRVDFEKKEAPPVVIDEDGRADFRNVQRFQTVEAGELLARLIPPAPGEVGFNVMGEEIPPPPLREPELRAGDNVRFDPATGEYRALKNGIFIRGDDVVSVSPVLEVSGNVGLSSGNIDYEGNVRVTGNLERGAALKCAGDCEVIGMIESHDVVTGGSLRVRKGINNRREGISKIEGNLSAVYVENSGLLVGGSVLVEKSIIGCDLVALGDIVLSGRQSTISGGELIAYGSVGADIVGSRAEAPTKITLGFHHTNQLLYQKYSIKLEEAERLNEKKLEKIHKIKIYIQRMRGKVPVDKQAAFRAEFKEYKQAILVRDKLQKLVKRYRQTRHNPDPVRLIVRDVLYPGVVIHYREYVEKITAPLSKCILVFRPGAGEPEMQAFKPERE